MATITPSPIDATAAAFAGFSADDYPNGQRVIISDDGNKEWEARGADGARIWVELATGHVDDHETTYDHDVLSGASGELVVTETDASPPVTVYTEDGTDWVYTEV